MPAAAGLLSLLVMGASANALPAAIMRAASDFQMAPASLAQAVSVQFAAFLLAAIAGGILADVVGKKVVLQGAGLLTAAGGLLWSVAGGGAMACAASVLLGLGGGILESMGSSVLSDLFPDRRKFFLNLSQVMFCVGAGAFVLRHRGRLPRRTR